MFVFFLFVIFLAHTFVFRNFKDDDDILDRTSGTLPQMSGTPAQEDKEKQDNISQPDARLASFVTGLLLSKPVQTSVNDPGKIQAELFEAWSVGLLSASLPWRACFLLNK